MTKKIKQTNNTVQKSALAMLLLVIVIPACDNHSPQGKKKVPTDFRDNSVTQLHSLSWLGGQSHPIGDSFQIADPENVDIDISPGGIVLTEVVDGFPLSLADLKAGDAIVRVAENWLPIKEDPTLDFIKLVEDQINAQKNEIEIGYMRSGKYATTKVNTEVQSLDDDLPLANQRFIDSSTAMLEQLVAMQHDDGSFQAASEDPEMVLAVTSLCGLALSSADPSVRTEFEDSIDRVAGYVKAQLADAEFTRELNPLAAAYVCCFLAEIDLSSSQDTWDETLGVLSFVFTDTQHENGGWNVTEVAATESEDSAKSDDEAVEGELGDDEESDDEESDGEESDDETGEDDAGDESVEKQQPDVYATFTTNMVLTSLGALERSGVAVENEMLEKGVAFLREQAEIRIPSSLDRRMKGVLSAGTVVALVALNLDRTDLQLRQYLKDGQDRAHDMYSALALGLPGMLHASLASRQLGNEAWLQHHMSTKHLLVALHDHEGRYVAYPGVAAEPTEFEMEVAGPAWDTAHVAMLHSMQSQSLRRMLAIEAPENLLARDSSGKKISKAQAAASGAKTMKLDINSNDPEEIKRLIMEQLKEQGMDIDESNMKIQTIDSKSDK